MKKLLGSVMALALCLYAAPPAQAAPSAPVTVSLESKSVSGTAMTSAVVGVTWSSSAGAVAYSVSALSTGLTTRTGSSPVCDVATCTSTVSDLNGGFNYDFYVSAFDGSGVSSTSSVVHFTPKSIPSAPSVVSAVGGANQVTLTWTAPSNTGGLPLGDYIITDGHSLTQSVPNASSSYVYTGLSAGTTYNFSIVSQNSLGSSSKANFTAATTFNVPARPNSPVAVITGTSMQVTWALPSDGGLPITEYKVYLFKNGIEQTPVTSVSSGVTTTFSNLADGTYTAQVLAHNSAGDGPRSPNSNPITVSTTLSANDPVFSPSSLPDLVVGQSQSVSATSPSGAIPSFAVASGICSYASGRVTAVAAGLCTLTASVPATTTFAAGFSSTTFRVRKTQTITFGSISSQKWPGPFALRASASSNLPVTFQATGACRIQANNAVFLAIGVCNVTASQIGDLTYAPAATLARSFIIYEGAASSTGGVPGSATIVLNPGQPNLQKVPSNVDSNFYYEISPEIAGSARQTLVVHIPKGAASSDTSVAVTLHSSIKLSSAGFPEVGVFLLSGSGARIPLNGREISLTFTPIKVVGQKVVFSASGVHWVALSAIPSSTLPAGSKYGYLSEGVDSVLVVTKVLGNFGLKLNQQPLAAKAKSSRVAVGKFALIRITGGTDLGVATLVSLSPKICKVIQAGSLWKAKAIRAGVCSVRARKVGVEQYLDVASNPLKIVVARH